MLLSSNIINFLNGISLSQDLRFAFLSVNSIIYGILQHYFLLLLTLIIMIENFQLLNT